jgi:hypothetical protein
MEASLLDSGNSVEELFEVRLVNDSKNNEADK